MKKKGYRYKRGQIIPKCIGTPGLIAFILAAKFVDALPFYQQFSVGEYEHA